MQRVLVAAGLIGALIGVAVVVWQVHSPASTVPDVSWSQAWKTGNEGVLEEWFRDHTGPTVPIDYTNPVTGTVTIERQADAEALVGRYVQGTIVITGDDVFLHDLVLDPGTMAPEVLLNITGATGVRIWDLVIDGKEDPRISVALGGASYSTVDVRRVEIRGACDGIRLMNASRYENVYVHDPFRWDDSAEGRPYDDTIDTHSDGMQAVGGAGIDVMRSFIDMGPPNDAHTSAVLLKPDSSRIDDVTVSQSYLNGGLYPVHVHPAEKNGSPTRVTVADNRFGPDYTFGIWSITAPIDNVTRTGNVWSLNLTPVPLVEGTFGP